MGDKYEILTRSILAAVWDEGLNPDKLPLGTAGFAPASDVFLPVAKHAEIPEANTEHFLRQVEAWVWQFRFAWMINSDRQEFEFALNQVKKVQRNCSAP